MILNRSVHNLTNIKFNDNVLCLLSLNLKFCPTPKPLEDIDILNDFNNFARLVRLNFQFNNIYNPSINFDKYKIKNSLYQPLLASNSIETYLYGVQNKISENLLRHPIKKFKPSKYTKLIFNLIKYCNKIKKDNNILYIPSDKNLGITIVDKSWYLNECYRHLNDLKTYTPLSIDPNINYVYNQLKDILIKYNIGNNSNLYKYLLQNINKTGYRPANR